MWGWAAAAIAGTLCGGEGPTVSVATVSPGGDLFSSMGHTALVFEGGPLKQPEAFDWGAFEQRPDAMILFLRGELPYLLHHQRWSRLLRVTEVQDRTLVLQRLALPEDAVLALLERVQAEATPERRAYAYRWDTDNCATRARDAVDDASGGLLRRATDHAVDTTARFEGARHLGRWPVPLFAWRFVTSSHLDAPLTAWDRAMVPEHLMRELDGSGLVAQRCTVREGAYGWAPPTPPPAWPWVVPGLVGGLALLATRGRDRATAALVALAGLVLSLLGTTSFLLWTITSLPGVGPTVNWLVAGPQSWLLVAAGVRRRRGPLPPSWRAPLAVLAGMGLSTPLVHLLPGVHAANLDQLGALLPALLFAIVALLR